jgi:hypothetical protein
VRVAHDRVEFVVGHSYHQLAAHDATAHAALEQKRQTTEHLSFGDVSAFTEHVSNPLRQSLVVRHAAAFFPY